MSNEDQTTMREVQVEQQTVRSHGVTVARSHISDWLILMLLLVILLVLNVIIHPFYRFVGRDMVGDFKYPLKNNTVPIWAVPIYAVLLPIFIFLMFYLYRKDVYDLHHAILGVLFSVLVTGVITDAIKDAVGRPRPDFFWRCFPDGNDVYDRWGNVVCHGDKYVVREGHKSFPSAHTSWSFAGLGFLSLYLAGKIYAFDRRGHVAKLCVVWLPLLFASLVGISRVDDYWHHWQDVFAGGLLGFIVATFCYLQFFPPPYHVQGWATYARFGVREESRGTNTTTVANVAQSSDYNGVENQQQNGAFIGMSLSTNSGTRVDDMESGRR